MELQKQIEIIKELLEATKELNGEYQEGWDENIENGERLLEYLQSELKKLRLGGVSFSLRDKFAMEAMNGELSSQGGVDGCVWANEIDLAERAYLVADAMIKARSNES